MTQKELRQLASVWLAPVDSMIADLLDKSERMPIGAFLDEVGKAVDAVPNLFELLDRKALEDALEMEMTNAVTKSIEMNL
jgi:hypothetical protein